MYHIINVGQDVNNFEKCILKAIQLQEQNDDCNIMLFVSKLDIIDDVFEKLFGSSRLKKLKKDRVVILTDKENKKIKIFLQASSGNVGFRGTKGVVIGVYSTEKDFQSKILDANYFEKEKIYLPWSDHDINEYLKNNTNSILIS
jgi:hypothetical protein